MISGIMPCSGWIATRYPWQFALRTWARVCDEIVIVAYGMSEVPCLLAGAREATEYSQREGRRCEVHVRSIQEPPLVGFGGYGAYLNYGICFLENPEWVLAVEADYMISPQEAARMRSVLAGCAPDRELLMARCVTLCYDGRNKLYNPDFKNNFQPRDGYVWYRPIGCRPDRGIFPVPFSGLGKRNEIVNCEGFVRLRKGGWGDTFNSKFLANNPWGFNLLDTDLEFEHLSFTRDHQSLAKKLQHEYFVACGLDARRVLDGDEYYPRRYPELEYIPVAYSQDVEALRLMR